MLKLRGANLWDSQRIHDVFGRLVIGYGMPEVYDLAVFKIFLKELDDFDKHWYKSWKIPRYRHHWHWKFLEDSEVPPTYPETVLVEIAHRAMELSPANFYLMGQRAADMRNVISGPNLAFLREFSGLTDEEIGRSVFNYPPWANRLGQWVKRPESIPLAAVVLLNRGVFRCGPFQGPSRGPGGDQGGLRGGGHHARGL